MSTEVTLPVLGESVTDGTVSRWLKKVGDTVARDEVLLEVSTDKVDVEIPSPAAGVLVEIRAQEDQTVPVGGVLAIIADSMPEPTPQPVIQPLEPQVTTPAAVQSELIPPLVQPMNVAPVEPLPAPEPAPMLIPPAGPALMEPTQPPAPEPVIITSFVPPAAPVVAGPPEPVVPQPEPVVPVETPAPTEAAEPPVEGPAAEPPAPTPDEEVPAYEVPLTIPVAAVDVPWDGASPDTQEAEVAPDADADEEAPDQPAEEGRSHYVTPLVRKLAREAGLPLDEIEGSGVGGRIRKTDVLNAMENAPAVQEPPIDTAPEPEVPQVEEVPPAVVEPEPEPQETEVEPEPAVVESPVEEPEPVAVAEEPEPVEPEPEPIATEPVSEEPEPAEPVVEEIEPELAPVVEPEQIPVAVVEPELVVDTTAQLEPIAVDVEAEPPAEPEPVDIEPEPVGVEPEPVAEPEPVPTTKTLLAGTTEKMTRLRSTIARRMVESLQVSAQQTATIEVDMTSISRLRSTIGGDVEAREGEQLSYLAFIAKAVLEALREYPKLNATIDTQAGTITYADGEHLGIAITTQKGLLVPVIRNAGDLTVEGLCVKITDLEHRTANNQILPDDLVGGTFTIVDYGGTGTLFDTPIINQPQVGILGAGALTRRPVVVGDPGLGEVIAVRDMMYLSLSYDHRLIDGSEAARFLSTIKARLEAGDFGAEF